MTEIAAMHELDYRQAIIDGWNGTKRDREQGDAIEALLDEMIRAHDQETPCGHSYADPEPGMMRVDLPIERAGIAVMTGNGEVYWMLDRDGTVQHPDGRSRYIWLDTITPVQRAVMRARLQAWADLLGSMSARIEEADRT